MQAKALSNQSSARRRPRQARALDKVELMFEAAIRILEDEGLQALTTNRIAALAGVSIGTLYQYFPDKESLVAALAQRELEQTFARLHRSLASAKADTPTSARPGPERAAQAVRVMLGALGGRTRARHQLITAISRSGQIAVIDEQLQALTHELLLGRARPAGEGSALNADEAFVIARAVTGVLRAAVLQDDAWLRRPAFEAALIRLVSGFFRDPVSAAASTRAVTGDEPADSASRLLK